MTKQNTPNDVQGQPKGHPCSNPLETWQSRSIVKRVPVQLGMPRQIHCQMGRAISGLVVTHRGRKVFFLDRQAPERKFVDFLLPNRTADRSGMGHSILGLAVTHRGRKVFFWTVTNRKGNLLIFWFRTGLLTVLVWVILF